MLGLLLSEGANIRNRTWGLIALAIFTLTVGLTYKPGYASSEMVDQHIKSVLNPKPEKSWDERIAPQLQKAEEQRQEAQRLAAEAEAKRVAEEARLLAEQQAVAQATVVKPPQPAPITGSCAEWMNAAGITDKASAHILIMRESGCNPSAVNPSSGACGIPQALPCSKLGTTDPVGQIRWMQDYVMSRYGSWANALAHSNANNWY